jgi:hypothetical protein
MCLRSIIKVNYSKARVPLLWLVGTILVLGTAPLAAQTRSDYCGANVSPSAASAPVRAGRYLNSTFGFSLTIPDGLSANGDGRTPERGLIIALSQNPRATLSVDAAYDIFYDITAEGVHRRDINTIRLHDALLDDRTKPAALDRAAGGRYTLQFQCRGDAMPLVHEEAIVVRNREIYRVDLQSTPERYAADLRVFNALLKSWHWEKPRPP